MTHYRVYLMRRMKGAIADSMRSADWMTRSDRERVKRMTEASPGGLILDRDTDEELAARAGLTVAEVHRARIALNSKPFSLDEPGAAGDGADLDHRDPPAEESTESREAVNSILAAAVSAIHALPLVQMLLIIERYYYGKATDSELAEATGIDVKLMATELEPAILAVHAAMVQAATG